MDITKNAPLDMALRQTKGAGILDEKELIFC
jgi:hypothetical protein